MFDLVIIGGGIVGNALAAALARAGNSVLVLERFRVYRDCVLGEYFQPWGVAELQTLGLFVPIDKVIPGVPGALSIAHPPCEALAGAASAC